MRRWILLSALLCVVRPCLGQQIPLQTESAEVLGLGKVRTEFGVEFFQRARYPVSGLEGDLTRVGVCSVQVGVGEYADFQIYGVVQDFLSVTSRDVAAIQPTFSGNSTNDFGDLFLGTKLRLAPERTFRPAVAFKFAAELPNAGNESGLGNDETNFFASMLLSKRIRSLQLSGNLGLAILGSPVEPNSQADQLTYGFAAHLPLHPKLKLIGEINGREGPNRLGNETRAYTRLGVQLTALGLDWSVLGAAGLKHFDPRSGIVFGLSYEFHAFNRKRGPATVK